MSDNIVDLTRYIQNKNYDKDNNLKTVLFAISMTEDIKYKNKAYVYAVYRLFFDGQLITLNQFDNLCDVLDSDILEYKKQLLKYFICTNSREDKIYQLLEPYVNKKQKTELLGLLRNPQNICHHTKEGSVAEEDIDFLNNYKNATLITKLKPTNIKRLNDIYDSFTDSFVSYMDFIAAHIDNPINFIDRTIFKLLVAYKSVLYMSIAKHNLDTYNGVLVALDNNEFVDEITSDVFAKFELL